VGRAMTHEDVLTFRDRDDEDIAQAALNAIKRNVWVPKETIKVEVEEGWVTLKGAVDYKFQRTAAEGAVQHLTGVTGVSNLIVLKTVVAPSDLKVKIENAFKRAGELDGKDINVEVDGNKVILRGVVSSLAERDEAERAAWSATGVWNVDDQLEIVA